MSDESPSADDQFGRLVDEILDALRHGKVPTAEEFARRYAVPADEIREILPALVLMEKARSPGRD
jgi:hypothetical protein